MQPNGSAITRWNGTGWTNGRVLPPTQGVSISKPKALRNGIVFYGKVAASNGGHFYTVRKKHVGRFRYSYQCTCDGWFLGGYLICRHIALFKLAETEVASNGTEGTVDAGALAS